MQEMLLLEHPQLPHQHILRKLYCLQYLQSIQELNYLQSKFLYMDSRHSLALHDKINKHIHLLQRHNDSSHPFCLASNQFHKSNLRKNQIM